MNNPKHLKCWLKTDAQYYLLCFPLFTCLIFFIALIKFIRADKFNEFIKQFIYPAIIVMILFVIVNLLPLNYEVRLSTVYTAAVLLGVRLVKMQQKLEAVSPRD